MQALSLKEVHEEEDEMDDAAQEAEELQAERIREAKLLSRSNSSHCPSSLKMTLPGLHACMLLPSTIVSRSSLCCSNAEQESVVL